MDFLVEMQLEVPPDYDPVLREDLGKRERARAAEIMASSNFFKWVWIPPGQKARIMICSAVDAVELHETISSLPAMPWAKFEVTSLVACEVGAPICMPN